MRGLELGASLYAPVAPVDFYRAVLDVRGFPLWAPGVRRVEVLSGEGEAGMLSEWEVSFLGFGGKISSVLEDAESPFRLCWTYAGPIVGWGSCSMQDFGDGAVAEFRTELAPADPLLARLARNGAARDLARGHLRRSLLHLGRLVAGDAARVLVGPVTGKPGARGARLPRRPDEGATKKEGPGGPSPDGAFARAYSK